MFIYKQKKHKVLTNVWFCDNELSNQFWMKEYDSLGGQNILWLILYIFSIG